MKYSLGKPKLLIQADDFYDFMSQEASAFFAFINAFTTFLRRLIMLTSLSLIFLVDANCAHDESDQKDK